MYANLDCQAKSKQKIIDKMEAAGLIEKIEHGKPLTVSIILDIPIHNLIMPHRFNFEDISKLPPPIVAFDKVTFSYSGQKKDHLYEKLSFSSKYTFLLPPNNTHPTVVSRIANGHPQSKQYSQIYPPPPDNKHPPTLRRHHLQTSH
jgi:hypothetical protein